MGLFGGDIVDRARVLFAELAALDTESCVSTINTLRLLLHEQSPFASEPVDCVQWIPYEEIRANNYNPNSVAPPEMRLLEHSIVEDGYTQPVVAWETEPERFEVVDGFHRHRVGLECASVRERVRGYLPVSVVAASRPDRRDRIAATTR